MTIKPKAKDLAFKAKTKNLAFKAKAKDLTFKDRAKDFAYKAKDLTIKDRAKDSKSVLADTSGPRTTTLVHAPPACFQSDMNKGLNVRGCV